MYRFLTLGLLFIVGVSMIAIYQGKFTALVNALSGSQSGGVSTK